MNLVTTGHVDDNWDLSEFFLDTMSSKQCRGHSVLLT